MSTEDVSTSVSPEIQEKIAIGKQKKDEADQAFKAGEIQKGMEYFSIERIECWNVM